MNVFLKRLLITPVKACVMTILLLGLAFPTSAQVAAPPAAGKTGTEELMRPGALPESSLGDQKAPVTIVEYASLTCPHCATFHKDSLPALKRDYIDTGKVRFIFRDFPFDGLALAGTMLARCHGPEKYFAMINTLFAQQETWAFSKDPEAAVKSIWKEAGYSQESFDSCMQNQIHYDAVLLVRQRAHELFGVDSTPTFFINGNRYAGVLSPQQLEAIIKPLLSEQK